MGKDHSDGAHGMLYCGGVDSKKVISGSYTFSLSYTTGGEDPGINDEFRGGSERVIVGSFPVAAGVAAVKYISGKLVAYNASGAEIASATNLSSLTIEYIAIGLV